MTDLTHRAMMDARKARMARQRMFTAADGAAIVDGGLYWNNDLKVVRVSFAATANRREAWATAPSLEEAPDFDGWFECMDPTTGRLVGGFDASRLGASFQGKRAVDAI